MYMYIVQKDQIYTILSTFQVSYAKFGMCDSISFKRKLSSLSILICAVWIERNIVRGLSTQV
jgi:hypothetical protein